MLLCTKIRLEVSERDAVTLEWMQGKCRGLYNWWVRDAVTLEWMQGKCRGLYNWWVMKLRDGEKGPGWAEAKKTLQASRAHDPKLKGVYGKLLQEVYFRLDAAMKAFFRRVKNGEKPGFPRVRPRHTFFTLIYPAMYMKVQGRQITLPTGGKGKNKPYPDVVAKLTEEAPTGYKDVAISRDGQGHYYASFVREPL